MAGTPINFGELDESEYTGPLVGGNKADTLIWDCTKNFDPTDFAVFDGGAGNDTLTLKLYQWQVDAMMAEIHATQPGAKIKDGVLIGDGSTFSGNNWQSLSSLGITVKNWETVKIQAIANPPANVAPDALDDHAVAMIGGKTVVGNALTNDTDADNDALSITSVTYGSQTYTLTPGENVFTLDHGVLTISANGDFIFTHVQKMAPGEIVTDAVSYTISDGHAHTDTATINFKFEGKAGVKVSCDFSGVNWNFEHDAITMDGFNSLATPFGWVNELGTSLEIANGLYGTNGVSGQQIGYGDGEHQWLDTAASAGNIHISSTTEVDTGRHAQLSVSVSAQDLFYQGGEYLTDPNASVDFKFNDQVLTIDLDDFKDSGGNVDWNHFHTFNMDVVGAANTDTLDIISHGQGSSYVGFSVDHVALACEHLGEEKLVGWDFEGYNVDTLPQPASAPNQGWVIVNDILPVGGMKLAGTPDMEVARDTLYGNDLPFTREASGPANQHQWLDTAGTSGPIHFQIDNTDLAAGESAQLKVGVAAELLMRGGAVMGATDQSQSIDFKYGNDTLHIDMGQFLNVQNDWTSGFDWNHVKEFTMDVHGTAGVDHLDVQAVNGGNIGMAVDYISLKDWIV